MKLDFVCWNDYVHDGEDTWHAALRAYKGNPKSKDATKHADEVLALFQKITKP